MCARRRQLPLSDVSTTARKQVVVPRDVVPCRWRGTQGSLMEFWTLSRRDVFRDANFVEIEVAEASHSKVGVYALLYQRHDLKSYSLFSPF